MNERTKRRLPPKPGTAPVPKGHVRLYHQTAESNLDAIEHEGLRFAKARGIEGPRGIYADERGFYGEPAKHPTVEFHVAQNRWQPPFVTGEDVSPSEIVGIHRPWHRHAHYIENNPEVEKAVVSGKHDDLLSDPEYAEAIRYIKEKHDVGRAFGGKVRHKHGSRV